MLEVLDQVRPLVLNSARAVELMWRPEGVSVGMRAVLGIVADVGPMPVPAIAERLDLARQGVQRHVNDLCALSLVQTRPNPGHQRSVLIAITEPGRDLCDRIRRHELAQLGDRMAVERTDEQLQTAAMVLTALNRDVRNRVQTLRTGQ